jgi:Fe-S cluster biogenesis protein NfuA
LNPKNDLKTQVKKALAEIEPMIASHGGEVKVIEAKDGKVTIKAGGACVGCPMAQATFGAGMEELIKEKVPAVKEVKFV